ncbi:Serine/threonine-protein kinase PknD [Oopsacas minuta]|uniref:Serine/threonine-protein kinase PknD n=1 Tax=Oopsacas minuta TaxID=111878 RepID=A0AAV7JGG0_9METZ|nr:Serine/threonine-protein kinase PknD [Oopsacas minuta]
MATGNLSERYDGYDNFVLELSRVREKIKCKFTELSDCLKEREHELYCELDKILASYHSYRKEVEEANKKKEALEKHKEFLENELLDSSVREIHEPFLRQVVQKLNSIETPIEPKSVHFECDVGKLFDEVKKLGKLVERIFSVDYKNKIQPIVSVCEWGYGLENLNGPQGVTIDNTTGNIYVADCLNNCVKVLDNNGKILSKFGDEKGEGKMYRPMGLAICRDRILITHQSCILNYQVNGKFICRIGKPGKGDLEFDYPRGLTFDESNGEVYICDSDNNRIQILSQELTYKTQFGQDNLESPLDVKLTKEFIYILDRSNPCLHLYGYNLILNKSLISRGDGLQLNIPRSFYIDNSNNILITNHSVVTSGSISIFNSQFDLIHKIYIAYPTGITVANRGRVIVVCARVQMSKPESAIKRADELIEVENYDDAIEVIFDVLRNKRHRDKVNEQSLVTIKFC